MVRATSGLLPNSMSSSEGDGGCLPKELSLVAVWKEPSVLGAEPNEKPVSAVSKKSSVSEREIFVSRTHQTRLAKG